MISAVDTNVLLDIFSADVNHGPRSKQWLRDARDKGDVIICVIVYAELVPAFDDQAKLDKALQALEVKHSSINKRIAYEAGLCWMQYRRAGGPRKRIISDFLIGAHAMIKADAFLTRDRGFYKGHFPNLSFAT